MREQRSRFFCAAREVRPAIEVVRQLKNEYPHDFLFCLEEANLRKDAGEGMRAVDAYRQIQTDNAKPGYFAEARMELADFGWAMRCVDSATTMMRRGL